MDLSRSHQGGRRAWPESTAGAGARGSASRVRRSCSSRSARSSVSVRIAETVSFTTTSISQVVISRSLFGTSSPERSRVLPTLRTRIVLTVK